MQLHRVTDEPELNERLIERWDQDDTPQGFVSYLFAQGFYPPGYDPNEEYDVELFYPPDSEAGVLVWNTSQFGTGLAITRIMTRFIEMDLTHET